MVEIRAYMKNTKETSEKLEELGAKFKGDYVFTDFIYKDPSKKIDLNKEFLRLRV